MKNISISSIQDSGISNQERILLKADGIDNVGKYILLLTTENTPTSVSSKPRGQFWLPDQEVKQGDFIQVYTNAGQNTSFVNKAGTTTYVFHWGSSITFFTKASDAIALLAIEEWEFKSNH